MRPRKRAAPPAHVIAQKYRRTQQSKNEMIRELVLEHGRMDILATFVLGYGTRQDEDGNWELEWFHEDMIEWQDQHKEGLYLGFRGSRKTTFMTITRTIFEILLDGNARILLASDAAEQSKSFLRAVKSHFERNEKLREIFGDYVTDAPKWADNEIIVNKRTAHYTESTVTCVGTGTALLGRHFDVVICDDLVSEDSALTEGTRNKTFNYFYKTLVPCLLSHGRMWVVGCVTGSTFVLMEGGHWKLITEVRPGDRVWSFDEKKRRLVVRRVEAMIPQGTSEILEIKTARHAVRVTPNHPFLTVRTGKIGPRSTTGKWKLEWKQAADLKEKDVVLTIGQVEPGTLPVLPHGLQFTEEFAWLFGFLLGDGWVTVNQTSNYDRDRGKRYRAVRYATCCAIGVDANLNRRVSLAFLNWCGVEPVRTKFGYVRLDQADVGRALIELGLEGGAKGKRLRPWVYSLPLSHRRALLRGLVEADGWKQKRGKAYRIELANQLLLEDVYWLALTSGVRPTSITHRSRWIKPPHSRIFVHSNTWQMGLVFDEPKNQRCGIKFNDLDRGIRLDRIVGVTSVGQEEVFDLTVAGTHNFIADGFVVHNTRWHEEDLYGWLEKEDYIGATYILGVLTEDDESIWEGEFPTARMLRLRRANPGAFELQWMCRAGSEVGGIFTKEHFRYYDDLPADVHKWQGVDLAAGQKSHNDFFAHVTAAVQKVTRLPYLINYRKTKIPFPRQVEFVAARWFENTDVIGVVCESNAYQDSLRQQIKETYPVVPAIPRVTMHDKIARAQQLAFLFTDHPLHVKRGHADFVRLMIGFPHVKGSKDVFDALEIALGQGMKGKRKARRVEPGLI